VTANDIHTDILTYSRAKGGLFAGAALGSASMESDDDGNNALYGKPLHATQIVRSTTLPAAAPSAKTLIDQLTKLSPKRL
jgi:lipid-binding SYLF domain-containing protein